MKALSSIYNFCAGPAMLPKAVMEQAQSQFLNWQGSGCSSMELSHRSTEFISIAEQAEQDLRELLHIPQTYAVLFMHGGGRGQFSAVPMNLLQPGETAQYVVSGMWSKNAIAEAKKFGHIEVLDIQTQKNELSAIDAPQTWNIHSNATYLHYCPNETIDGIEIFEDLDIDCPVVADMSSTILSRKIDVEKYDLIYAGAQKNIGPAGLAIVIVKKSLLNRAVEQCPDILNYTLQAEYDSMLSTPPTYSWYLSGLVFSWLRQLGGLDEVERLNKEKATMLYNFIDESRFYHNRVDPAYRSRMNVPFILQDEKLDKAFLVESEKAGLLALKGHRIVGGMRASIYNAMPIEGVKALIEFMYQFEKENR
ncbi:3-phosphoserine/phosphohydroxythreonine transaminase [Algicola sagamiensis]|uniref:3-phosphoserine/phosphohydroxythreonine transaminase n=1 Tax=Algicola sagamiensis TaxID=163869 RepID=UPI00039D2CEB|nr:3-phosphoserine/phosphohydroxythreonine transaminase [Algicola sagamiensis]